MKQDRLESGSVRKKVRALWVLRAGLRKHDGFGRGLDSEAYNAAWSLPDLYFCHVHVHILTHHLPNSYHGVCGVRATMDVRQNSSACLESNSSSALSKVYSTATRPIELYDRRCSLNRSDWKFADYNLYEGPHKTIVDQVIKDKVISCHSQADSSLQSVIFKKQKGSGVACDLTEVRHEKAARWCSL